MGLTADLCRIISLVTYETLGAEAVDRTKQAIKDGIAVAVAGSDQEPVRILAEHLRAQESAPRSTAWSQGYKTSPVSAAYVNGAATHVLDYEPMWSPPTHSVSPTVPVAFALAESMGLSGREVITAVAKGLEIQGRIVKAANQVILANLRYHPPGVVGVLGATVTAAHLLGLDENGLVNALGIAASRAGALLANIGTMTKCAHCGFAGAAGLDAALLAKRGFTGNSSIFEARNGYLDVFFPTGLDESILLNYGKPFRFVDPGLAIKLFPCQYATHFGITAALQVRAQITDPEQIVRVRMTTPVMPYVDRPFPETGLDGKFSYQYTTSAALLDNKVNIDTFSDERRFRADMVAFLNKVELAQLPEIPGDFHGMHVEVAVELADGSTISATSRGPKGFWGLPKLTRADHHAKLTDCLARQLSAEQIEEYYERVESLDRATGKDIQALMALIGNSSAK